MNCLQKGCIFSKRRDISRIFLLVNKLEAGVFLHTLEILIFLGPFYRPRGFLFSFFGGSFLFLSKVTLFFCFLPPSSTPPPIPKPPSSKANTNQKNQKMPKPKKELKYACQKGDVEKVKQVLQKFPSLLNERLDSVFFFFFFFFFWFMVELFHGCFVVMFEGYLSMMFLRLILSPFFLFLFFRMVILPSILLV